MYWLDTDQDLGLCPLGKASYSLWNYIFEEIIRREIKDHYLGNKVIFLIRNKNLYIGAETEQCVEG